MRLLLIFTILFSVVSCVQESKITINRENSIRIDPSTIPPLSVNNLSINSNQNQLTLTGLNLSYVDQVKVTGPGIDQVLEIDSKTNNELKISALSAGLQFLGSTLYNFVLSTAAGNTTIPVEFSPSQLGANTGDVLQWNGTNWTPIPLSGINMVGSWDAFSNTPSLVDGGLNTNPNPGDFYVVSVSGPTPIDGNNTWNNGDWILFNGTTNKWERVNNASGVTSFKGRTGGITPTSGDYDFSQIANVPGGMMDYKPANTACANGEVLKYNSLTPGWECGSDNDTIAPAETDPTVSAFAKAALPICNLGEVLKSDGTSFSCVVDQDTTILDTVLNETQVEGYIANDITTNYIPFDNGTKLVDSFMYISGLDIMVGASNDFCISGGNCLSNMSATTGTVTSIATGTGLTGGPISTTGTISIAAGGVGNTEIANGAVDNTKISGVNISKINSAASEYLTYKPNNVACTNGQVLKWNNTSSRWECANDTDTTITETDPTVSAFAKVALPTCTGGQVLKSDGTSFTCVTDSTIADTTLAGSAAGGSLTGTYPNPTIANQAVTNTMINGVAANCGNGQVLKANGTGGFICANDIDTTIADTTLSGTSAGGDLSGTYPNPTIANLKVTTAKLANQAVTNTKISGVSANCANGQVLKANGTGGFSCANDLDTTIADTTLSGAAAGGDLTGTYPNPTVANLKITTAKVANQAITNMKISGVTANCASGQVLKANGTGGFSCANDTDTTIPDTTLAGTAAGGDLTGTYPNPTLKTTGVAAGTYPKVTVDTKGRVTGGSALAASDIPNLDATKITTGTLNNARLNTNVSLLGQTIEGTEITNGTIANADIANQAITNTKMSGIASNCVAGQVMVADGSGGFYCDTIGGRVTYQASVSNTSVAIPESVIIAYCGDIDGCKIRIGMYNWDGTGRTASREYLFYYNATNRNWRSSADAAGTNNNGTTQHAFNPWSCYFTDGAYSNGTGLGDTNTNFNLLNWSEYAGETCQATIID